MLLKWIGRYATYGDSKKDKFPGTLVIHQQGKPEYSGTLTEQEEKGQGTSSMLYDFWNGDFRFIKGGNGTWTDELGIVHGQYFQLGPGMPKATKMSARLISLLLSKVINLVLALFIMTFIKPFVAVHQLLKLKVMSIVVLLYAKNPSCSSYKMMKIQSLVLPAL